MRLPDGNGLDLVRLINSKVLSPLRLATFLSETFGMPLMDLASLDFSTLPLDQIDRKLLAETRVIPLIKRGNRPSRNPADGKQGENTANAGNRPSQGPRRPRPEQVQK